MHVLQGMCSYDGQWALSPWKPASVPGSLPSGGVMEGWMEMSGGWAPGS